MPEVVNGCRLALLLAISLAIALGAEATLAHTSDYTVDVWQVEEGLPQISVTSIKQTSDGYLWLGTFNGLARFDGVRFTVFDEGNTPALGSSRIVRLDLDQVGGLWIITEDGALARLREGRFRRFTAQEGLPPAGAAAVVRGPQSRVLLVDREGGVWWLDGEKWLPDPRWRFLQGNPVTLFTDAEENLWVWFRQKRTLGRIVAGQVVLVKGPGEMQDAEVRAFALSRDGGLWLVISNRIWHYRLQGGEWKPTAWELPESAHSLTYMLEDRHGNLWLGTYGQGLLCFGPSAICERFTTSEGLSHNAVRALWEDREGSIWVGTDGGGLNRLKPRAVGMYDVRQGLTAEVVMSIAQDPRDADALWLGINGGGVNRLYQGKIAPLIVEPLLHTNAFVYGLFSDRHGGLWIGSYDQGILRYHDGVLTCLAGGDNWAGRPLLTGLEDHAGTIWLGGGFGVFLWRDGLFTNLNPQLGWSNVMVRAVAEDRNRNLYVGSFGKGLSQYHQGQWTHYAEKDGLADNHITALYADGDDTLWIGTANGGLCRFRQGRFATITLHDGLPSNSIGALLEDDQGCLWLGSNRGLIRLPRRELNDYLDGQRRTLTCRVHTRSDGLNSIQCAGGAQPSCWKTRDGQLWFATVKGLAVVDPSNLPYNSLPPPVVIEEVALDDKSLVSGPWSGDGMARATVNETDQVQTADHKRLTAGTSPRLNSRSKTLTVPPGTHGLEIRFTGLSLMSPEKVRFRYRLEGLDEDWIEAGARRTASYAHIPPGEYRFRVTACNNDGVWNDIGAALSVTVVPYFWQTSWCKALALLGLIGGTGWLMQRASTQRLQRRLERLEHQSVLDRERSRIAQDIHDDLGARLTQIKLLSELATRDATSPAQLRSGLGKIATLTRGTTQAIDEIVWAVDPTKDNLEGLLDYLAHLTQELLDATSIRCRLDIPVVASPWPVSARARHNLLLVAKEALNNCIKHSGASEVRLRAALDGSVLSLEVADNGRGFPPADIAGAGQGCGLENMRRRVEELGGQFTAAFQPGQGTKIGLRIDLARND